MTHFSFGRSLHDPIRSTAAPTQGAPATLTPADVSDALKLLAAIVAKCADAAVVARGALAWAVARNAVRLCWSSLAAAFVPPHAFGGLTNPNDGLNGVAASSSEDAAAGTKLVVIVWSFVYIITT